TITIRIYGWGAGNVGSTFSMGRLSGDDISIGGSVILAKPTITSFTPISVCLGSTPTITITGTNFTGATSVKFNGVNATLFNVASATSITAVLPATGVSTGPISVTTPDGTGTS